MMKKITILAILVMFLVFIVSAQDEFKLKENATNTDTSLQKSSKTKATAKDIGNWAAMIFLIYVFVLLLTKKKVKDILKAIGAKSLATAGHWYKQWKEMKDIEKDIKRKMELLIKNKNTSEIEFEESGLKIKLTELETPAYFMDQKGKERKYVEELKKITDEIKDLNKKILQLANDLVDFTKEEENELHRLLKIDLEYGQGFENLKKLAKLTDKEFTDRIEKAAYETEQEKKNVMKIIEINRNLIPKIERFEKTIKEEMEGWTENGIKNEGLNEEIKLIDYILKETEPKMLIIESVKKINKIATALKDKFLEKEDEFLEFFKHIKEQKKYVGTELRKELKGKGKRELPEKRLLTGLEVPEPLALKIKYGDKMLVVRSIFQIWKLVHEGKIWPELFNELMEKKPELENYGIVAFFVKDKLKDEELANRINNIKKRGDAGMREFEKVVTDYFDISLEKVERI